ncbi:MULTISPECIES: amino acid ABC transporter ATP-binding protein [Lactobacillaceae]|jgi:cystine transport system ATP-binding protein|uniref:Arginine ABC transporter ATP-binding protein n=3 Tax=Limosilactobacillus mucosae TaxID=97478 RepID=A0A0D4CK73_LIMMU|nr:MULTISPECIES: amino acid ABC transporter ATP-binding protein [Lactobacillaceae]MDD6864372.1 amino acid ABC transporter ATP-binding protein [Lactobacillus sp.]AJT50474.1 arginine ABC transporter ATP-binding protein [Limosilactobacillus mucosae LM1]KRL25947.1 ABC superfamily ATP binding cassette transporter, ABC protein YckI [Limosilactobacillus mucosae DSM 13345]NME33838.1 amino acid ABC transporter ATP-binding protein [Lactobacillus sp. MRS-253-APC-2B]QOL69491.1 amino acid ABC transporter A
MKIEKINKWFGDKHVLKDIDLEFPAGQTTVLVGPSGSGKSTILRSLNLLEQPNSGTYDFDELHLDFERNVSRKQKLALRQKTGMVFQDYNLFPHLTVLQNITEGPRQVLKLPKETAEQTAMELLAKVGLKDFANAYPAQLSGGQAQRVAIARALAMKPAYVLLDEPTSALDPELELEVLRVLLKLAQENQSLIIVTHNMVFARRVADKIVFVEDGTIKYDGDPAGFFAPNNPDERIRHFIAAMTMEELEE